MNKKTFCIEPYKQIHFDSRGNMGPCCQFIGQRPDVKNLDEYLNSDWLENIKHHLSIGNKISNCEFCWQQEDAGAKSMRQKRTEYYEEKLDRGVEHIMITFGNQCNTACRICNASRSSLIEKQYKEMKNTVTDYNLLKLISKEHNWSKSKTWYRNIINDIVTKADTIRKLEISGGEPFINIHFDRLIDLLLNSKKKLPGLNITTNGSFNETQISKLEKFNHLHINFSIDGVGKDFYEYLRWPLKWDDVISKINILKKYPWVTCEFVIVPHNLNLLNLADSIVWLKEYTNYNQRFKIGFSWLNGAPWYSLDNTPKWVRDKVIADLESIILVDYTDVEIEQINELIFILKNANNPKELNLLKSHIAMTDSYRNCNTWDVVGWKLEEI
jgi:wyosine [tRNA(Phe)-imidazoG37] synthetase (radical SAM superfamily)